MFYRKISIIFALDKRLSFNFDIPNLLPFLQLTVYIYVEKNYLKIYFNFFKHLTLIFLKIIYVFIIVLIFIVSIILFPTFITHDSIDTMRSSWLANKSIKQILGWQPSEFSSNRGWPQLLPLSLPTGFKRTSPARGCVSCPQTRLMCARWSLGIQDGWAINALTAEVAIIVQNIYNRWKKIHKSPTNHLPIWNICKLYQLKVYSWE